MKTGTEIRDIYDIRIMVVYLCTTNNNFTKEEIYRKARHEMLGSKIVINKLLKTLIDQAVSFLVEKGNLIECNGIYSYNTTNTQTETLQTRIEF